jgi:hypothetical protein
MLLELSEKLVELRDATMRLRPQGDYVPPPGKEEERKQQRLARYSAAMKALYRFSEPRRPFLPEELSAWLKELDRLTWTESIQYRRRSSDPDDPGFDPKYWDTAEKNAAAVEKAVEAVQDAVRARVQRWERFDPTSE